MADSKNAKTHSIAWYFFWSLMFEIIVVGLIIPSKTIDKMRDAERSAMTSGMGSETALWAMDAGTGWYFVLFETSGIHGEVYHMLVPTERERQNSKGLQNLGQGWWFPYVKARIYVIFNMLEMGCIRLAVTLAWSPFYFAVMIPAMWDGMMDWKRRQYSFAYASPIMHGFGIRLVAGTPVIILVLIIAPFTLPMMVFPGLAVVTAFGVTLLSRHTQKRV